MNLFEQKTFTNLDETKRWLGSLAAKATRHITVTANAKHFQPITDLQLVLFKPN